MPAAMHVDHVGIWVRDLEAMRRFYVERLGGHSGPRYENQTTGLRSYFISFSEGARVELMSCPAVAASASEGALGFAHVALAVGSQEAVDRTVVELERRGVAVVGRPRRTGDGYYEAVVVDPEGNRLEIMA